ncbi:MAG: hypothetical protein GY867_03945 [bacterium]|nr:hypothetical protein [bacterium]
MMWKSWRTTFALIVMAALMAVVMGCSDSKPLETSRAVLSLTSDSLLFAAFVSRNPEPVRQKVFVTNSGEGSLTFEATYTAAWISLDPIGTDTIFVTVVSDTLPVGSYLDTITVASPEAANSPRYIEVSLEVYDWLAVSPDKLYFNALGGGANPPSDSLRVVKVGGGSVSFDATTTAPWITFDNAQGTTPATIVVNPDISSLSSGVLVDSVILTSSALPQARTAVPVRIAISSWSEQTVSGEVTLKGLHFEDDNIGWTSGFASSGQNFGFIYRTTNGGDTWSLSPVITGALLGGLGFFDADHGFVAADKGRLFETDNGGIAWTVRDDIPVDSSQSLRKLATVGPDTGWAVGTDGVIIRTTNGGADWSLQATPTGHGLNGASFVDAQTGWVSGLNGTVLHTDNGGLAWSLQNTGTSTDLRDIYFVDANLGWAVGSNGTILHTSNGGASWGGQDAGVINPLWSVEFVNDSTGWVVGSEGLVLRTNDAGLTWMVQLTSTASTLFDLVFRDDNLGWSVGEEGIVLRTASGGF